MVHMLTKLINVCSLRAYVNDLKDKYLNDAGRPCVPSIGSRFWFEILKISNQNKLTAISMQGPRNSRNSRKPSFFHGFIAFELSFELPLGDHVCPRLVRDFGSRF